MTAFQQVRPAARSRYALLLAALAVGTTGCEDERATFFEPTGPLAFRFGLTTAPVRVPSGTVAVAPDTVFLNLSWLRALQGGVYQVWGVARDANDQDVYTPLSGRLVEFFLRAQCGPTNGPCAPGATDTVRNPANDAPIPVTDSTVLAAGGGALANTYAGSDEFDELELVTSVRFLMTTADNTVNPAGQHAIVVSIETGTGSTTTPSTARFLYRRIGVGGGGGLQLGNFGGSDESGLLSPRDHTFLPSGAGNGAVRGPEVLVRFLNLPRPPIGFYYRGVMVDDTDTRIVIDTLRSDFSAVAGDSRLLMVDADENAYFPGISGNGILVSVVRNCRTGSAGDGCESSLRTLALPDSAPFQAIERVQLMLEPKLAAVAPGQGVLLTGDLPEAARR